MFLKYSFDLRRKIISDKSKYQEIFSPDSWVSLRLTCETAAKGFSGVLQLNVRNLNMQTKNYFILLTWFMSFWKWGYQQARLPKISVQMMQKDRETQCEHVNPFYHFFIISLQAWTFSPESLPKDVNTENNPIKMIGKTEDAMYVDVIHFIIWSYQILLVESTYSSLTKTKEYLLKA